MKYNLFSSFVSNAFGILSKNAGSNPRYKDLLLSFLMRVSYFFALTFNSLKPVELILTFVVTQMSNFLLFQVAIKLSQNHFNGLGYFLSIS
jgi:hypothetical protein